LVQGLEGERRLCFSEKASVYRRGQAGSDLTFDLTRSLTRRDLNRDPVTSIALFGALFKVYVFVTVQAL